MLNKLHAVSHVLDVPMCEFHLFLYLFWNKFVIHKGVHEDTGRVCAGFLLGHNAVGFGDIDLDAVLGRLPLFLSRQCRSLHRSQPPEIQAAFVNISGLLREFGLLVSAHGKCTSTKYVIQNLSIFEAQIALHRNGDAYVLGNTKPMLLYLSQVFEFAALQCHSSEIHDNLVCQTYFETACIIQIQDIKLF